MVYDWLNINTVEGSEGVTNLSLSATSPNVGSDRTLEFRVVLPDGTHKTLTVTQQGVGGGTVITRNDVTIGYNNILITFK